MMIYKMALEAKKKKENMNRFQFVTCLHLNLFIFLLVTN